MDTQWRHKFNEYELKHTNGKTRPKPPLEASSFHQTSARQATLPQEPESPRARLRLLAVTQAGLVAASDGQVEAASQRRRGQPQNYDVSVV